jgi:putative tricarboxylic transport membrane protein
LRKSDFISGIALLGFGLVFLLFVIPFDIEAGPEGVLPPSLVPNLMMGLIVFLSLILIVKNRRRPEGENAEDEHSPISSPEMKAVVWVVVLMASSILLFLWGGALPAAVVLVVGLMLAMGERRPLPLVLTPASLMLGAYLLFYQLLGTSIE